MDTLREKNLLCDLWNKNAATWKATKDKSKLLNLKDRLIKMDFYKNKKFLLLVILALREAG